MKSGVLELVTIAWSHVAFVLPCHRQGCFLCVYLLFDSTKYVLNTSMGQALWRIGIIFIMIICIFHHAATAKLLQLCPTLCNPIDSSPPGSPVPGILQARTLEWVAISFSNAWKWKVKSESEVTQWCPTPSDPMDCSLPGSSIHGICQARVLEWGAIAFSIFHHTLS